VKRFTIPIIPFWKPGAVAVKERAGVPQATSKTLYHGTTVEIARKAMQHGLYPNVGDFVREFYGSELDNLVFATDKSEITKATSAIGFHVARQLGISRHRLTSKQLYQHGALLVIRSGMDTNDHLYYRSKDDHLDYDDHPEQVEPGDYYGYEQIDPDYMLTGIKLKRFLTRLGLAQDKPNIMHPDQQQNVFIKRGQVPKPVKEDVESDLVNSKFLIDLTNAFQEKIRKHLQEPIYNSDYMFVKMGGKRMIKFRGAQFNWPGEFKSLWILLRDENSDPKAGFHAYLHPDGHKERIISFAVLPPEDEGTYDSERMDVALSRMVSTEWGGIMVHELQHVVQDIRDIPLNGKGSYTSGTPDTRDYYNNPAEFDAYYQQLSRGYHALLVLLRTNPQDGIAAAKKIGFDFDFKTSLDKMLPKEYDAPEWGVWYYARKKQNQRLTKRLYGLHQAIVKELTNMGLRETDEQHQDALDQTGFWGSAGAGCIIMAADTRRILLPNRSEWVQEPQTWGTWGGAIDPGENPKDAVMREVEEEAGYSGRVEQMIHLFRFQSGEFRYDTLLAVVAKEFAPNLNWETEEADWFEMDDLPSPLHFGLAAVLKDTNAQNILGTATSR
jgi:8-oxo-dGTP pyrophosphatase MutT (NUDIX family)